MIEIPLIVAAFFAGVLMFLAPCTLPLVPAYLAFIAQGGGRSRIFINALAFSIGFSVVFVALGVFAAFLGSLLGVWRLELGRAAGLLLIFFGLTMLGALRLPFISKEFHTRAPKFLSLGHPHSSFILGALFALGWSPCIGPILGTILLFASSSATALYGAVLLSVFSLGLAIPFLLTALFLSYAQESFSRAGKFALGAQYLGGTVLVLLGILMLLGRMDLLIAWGYGLFDFIGYEQLLQFL